MCIPRNWIRVGPGHLSATLLIAISNKRPLSQWHQHDSGKSSTDGPQFPYWTPTLAWGDRDASQPDTRREFGSISARFLNKTIVSQWGATPAVSPVKHWDTTAHLSINTPGLYSMWRCLGGWISSHYHQMTTSKVGQQSSVSIANSYRVADPQSESWWGWEFPHLSRPAIGPTQPPVKWTPGLSHSGKMARAWSWPSTSPSSKGSRKRRTIPTISLWAFMAYSRMKCYDHVTPVLYYILIYIQYTRIISTLNFSHTDMTITEFYL